jgi:rhodanese-related sulfurtransferase
MNLKTILALIAIFLGAGLLFFRPATIDDLVVKLEPQIQKVLKERQVHIDPAELLVLINNNNARHMLLDLRDEADYNLFHIIDSKRVSLDEIKRRAWIKNIPKNSVIVTLSDDEAKATKAWKILYAHKVPNIYLLEGGINAWLKVFSKSIKGHDFSRALGSRHPASNPDQKLIAKRKYIKKIKSIGRQVKKSGGCG